MAPPAPLVLIGLLWARVTRGRLLVDCHSKAVLAQPASARLARHADLVIVTLPELAARFPRAVALHDPPAATIDAPRHDEVVFPASWYEDEPMPALLDAARRLPDVRFAVTGTPPAGMQVPANVRLTGFLPREEFLGLLSGARVVLALTNRDWTMQRAAYEAVAAGRPVVASDTQALRGYLGDAACYAGDLASAIRDALSKLPELELAARRVREEQATIFARDLETVREAAFGRKGRLR
jgi:glycosyltransferase involved in cell wall biosynthesis